MEQTISKMKTYRTLFVTISKDKYHKDFEVHRFPYSIDDNIRISIREFNMFQSKEEFNK